MDQPTDISKLISILQTVLATYLPPGPSSSSTILPQAIPRLPTQLLTLPDSPDTSPVETTAALLQTYVLPFLNLSSISPNYYGFVTGGVTPAALLADWLVSVFDQNVAVHLPADTIATNLEVAALGLLVQLFGLPEKEWGVGGRGNGGGVFTTGATASNVLGLALGREWVIREAARRRRTQSQETNDNNDKDDTKDSGEVVSVAENGLLQACHAANVTQIQILSTLPHSSIAKAASVIGIGRANIIPIGIAANALDIDTTKLRQLASTMTRDRKAYILAISAGEVNTGRFATDGLETMKTARQICDEHGIWMHIDGAFGLFGRVLTPLEHSTSQNENEHQSIIDGVAGIELADSITGDGHKLLNVPYDSGLFFTRHKHLSEAVFTNGNAAYLTSGAAATDDDTPPVQSPSNIGLENSRRFRALPVWATLMAYGRGGYVDMLQRQIGLARRVVDWMWDVQGLVVLPKSESKAEAVHKTYMVVLFRASDEAVNQRLVKTINASGRIYVTGTKWDGLSAARIAVSNWQVDVERDFALIKQVLEECLA